MPGCIPGDLAVIIGPTDDPIVVNNVGIFVKVGPKTTPPYEHNKGVLCFYVSTDIPILKGVILNNLEKMEVIETDHIHYFPDKYLQPIRPPNTAIQKAITNRTLNDFYSAEAKNLLNHLNKPELK